jgi:hypothetical protein
MCLTTVCSNDEAHKPQMPDFLKLPHIVDKYQLLLPSRPHSNLFYNLRFKLKMKIHF